MKVKCKAMVGADVLSCSQNVSKMIGKEGGTKVFGWTRCDNGWYDELNAHCVWRDKEGNLWDVTPKPAKLLSNMVLMAKFADIEFEIDPDLTFDEFTKSPPNKHVCKSDDPNMQKALRYFSVSEVFLRADNLEKCRYWTARANYYAHKFGRHWDVPASTSAIDYLKTSLPV